jgi:integrating conjugative element protein (TIGR03746 family)
MVGRVRNGTAARDSHILSLRLTIFVLSGLCLAFWYGWKTAPSDLVIHNPPDLRSGSTRAWWEVHPSNVYTFSFYIWQQLNRWESNGDIEYLRQIDTLESYFTESCHIFLETDYMQRKTRGELAGRTRFVQEIPRRGFRAGPVSEGGSVDKISQGIWLTNLDLAVVEEYGGLPVKDIYVRYPLRIIRADIDPEKNPWGLQIDCFESKPEKIYKPNDINSEGAQQ